MSAVDLAAALRAGELSAREIVGKHIARIEACDGVVNAVCTRAFDQAMQAAARADERRAAGGALPPLHGLPIVHKDLLDTAGVRTTYGSGAFAEHVPTADATIVHRARQAGAIMLGKTNTPQFGTGGHTSNALFGTTRNPWDLGRTVGGSSGGSAAALAAGMSPLATGTDMAGSLRIPASFCNVVGVRPSPGRIPYLPTDMQWFPFITAGPMARSVRDAALLLSVAAGPEPHASISLDEPFDDLLASLEADVSGWRVAWAPRIAGLPVDEDVLAAIEPLRDVLETMGVAVREAEPDLSGAEEAFRLWRAWYYATQFGALLRERPGVLDDATASNIAQGLALTGDEIGRAEHLRSELFLRVATFFDSVDILVMPCTPVGAFPADMWHPDAVAGRPMDTYLDWMRHLYFLSVAGLPSMSLPAGFTAGGSPIGVQLVAGPRRDRALMQFAHALEQARGRVVPPE
jgi:amidase